MDIVLVNMPFGPLATPALGLSILAAKMKLKGISVKIEYFNVKFAQILGERKYKYFCDGYPATHTLFAEWIFSEFLNDKDTTTEYLKNVLLPELVEGHSPTGYKPFSRQEVIQLPEEVRNILPLFLDSCLRNIIEASPKIVGFTSTFQQHTSSLLLAKMIKKACPEVVIVFGGANCDGKMGIETLRNYPFIDIVVQGEAEITFPLFVDSVLLGEPNFQLPNLIHSGNIDSLGATNPTANFVGLDEIPYPDFDDFIDAWRFLYKEPNSPIQPTLLFETARGCWWGQKNHCTFCGLNGNSMAFRSKSPERVLNELKYLVEKYDSKEVTVVDNILDMKYFTTFIPMLRESKLDVDLFWEVKANLKYEHLQILKDAGITSIQPGIESFSNQVLKLMNKGVSAIQNLQFLKWCNELDIYAVWNLLYGFTHELPEEYSEQALLIPKITHFQPPTGYFPIRLDRYSPNFDRAEEFGFFDVKPMPAYNYIYSHMDPSQIYNMAYFFNHRDSNSARVTAYTEGFRRELRHWKIASKRSILIHIDDGHEIVIIDSRPHYSSTPIRKLKTVESIIYRLCETVCSTPTVRNITYTHNTCENEVQDSLINLLEWGYLVELDGKYLSLGIDIRKKVLTSEETDFLEKLFEIKEGAAQYA